MLHDNTSIYQLKPLAHLGLIPAALNNKAGETVIGTTNIKNSFMRTFLRKSGVFAIALLIANLFFAQQNFGQTVVTNPASPFTVPAGVTSIKVEVWGGGGGGGGSQNTLLTTGLEEVAAVVVIHVANFAVNSGQTYTITIGAAGTAGSNVNGGVGGTSTVTGIGGTVLRYQAAVAAFRSTAATGGAGSAGNLFNGGAGGTGSR